MRKKLLRHNRRRCGGEGIADRLPSACALIIGEADWQVKAKISRDFGHDFAFDLGAAGVVFLNRVVPVCTGQLDGVEGLIDRISERQSHLGIGDWRRSLGDGIDVECKSLAETAGQCAFALEFIQVQFRWVEGLAICITIIIQQIGHRIGLRTEVSRPDLATVADGFVVVFGDLGFGLDLGILGVGDQLEIAFPLFKLFIPMPPERLLR